MNRRQFLQQASLAASSIAAAATAAVPGCGVDKPPSPLTRAPTTRSNGPIAVVCDPADPVASTPPGQWALTRLRETLRSRGAGDTLYPRLEDVPLDTPCILIAGRSTPIATRLSDHVKITLPDSPESLAVVPLYYGRRSVLLASSPDARGLSYALTDIADAITYAHDPFASVTSMRSPTIEHPANHVRGVGRLFCSDLEDKPWYNDRAFWQRYLDMLAAQRFNRFHLSLGLGYDFARNVRDSYFYFPYPFFLTLPQYEGVRAAKLPDAERDANLAMLAHIAAECARRGIDFQLGLWCHQYEFADSPNVNHRIEGLNHDNHAPYCRDALAALLRACPAIAGVTFRIHGESGVAEGSYDFWRTVFDGVVASGRKIPIEMHAKGSDQQIIDFALATGMPVTLAPKYWAEHMGLPYAQSAIRATELPRVDRKDEGFFAKSSGSRSFLRYGYGDLLAEDRRFDVVHRMWPGTQRMLLWGDPLFASAYGRTSSFCGSAGAEIFEPMSFKGREGSGLAGGRQGYADESLKTADDWEKYRYAYVLWGRMLYNPDTPPEVYQRILRHDVGREAAPAAEAALASAGRILPMITTAHSQSASYNAYWVEMSWNMPIVDPSRRQPYSDTPSPKRFGTVSPLDPQLFARIDDFAELLLKGQASAKYTPAEVAATLQRLSEAAARELDRATGVAASTKDSPAFRRMAIDVALQCGTGTFFAHKIRAAVLWAIYDGTGDRAAVAEALKQYRAARAAWAAMADRATGVYAPDVTYGPSYFHRGHWRDRLGMIDQDITDMEKRSKDNRPTTAPTIGSDRIPEVIAAILAPRSRTQIAVEHAPPALFRRGQPVPIVLKLPAGNEATPWLHFRRVNQSEAYHSQEMQPAGAPAGKFSAAIPATYTDSPFPLQYYFELRQGQAKACLHPGFNVDWSNQPYYVIRQQHQAAAAQT
jgi:hypothetical protein